MPDEGPYRDGLQALLQPFEQERTRVSERAAALDGATRRRVPAVLRRELTDLEAQLKLPLESPEAVARAEKLLATYARAVDAALEMAEQQGAHQRRTAWRRRALWVGGSVLVVLAVWWGRAMSKRYDERVTQCDVRCKMDGRCHLRWSDVIYDRPIDCVATEQADCETACRIWGRCQLANEACRAATDEGCRRSERCRDLGECNAHRSGNNNWDATTGSCAIRSDADCRQSRACLEHGRCLVGEDACVASR